MKIALPDDLRVRLDWFDGPKICGVRAKKALLVSLDFTKPPSAETRELFGEDSDLFDFYMERGRASTLLREHFSWDVPRVRPTRAMLDLPWHFPLELIVIESEEKIPNELYRDVIPRDSAFGWFVRERYNNDWGAVQLALQRIGLNPENIQSRQCEHCELPVRSSDPAIRLCRHCAPRPPDPEAPSYYAHWMQQLLQMELPRYSSQEEVEREIRKTKRVWRLHCCFDQLDSPDFALDAIGWFCYEGLCGCFDTDSLLRGALLTTAEFLVKQHGFSWQLEDGVLFLSHPSFDAPVKADELLRIYGFCPPEEEEYEPILDLKELCTNAIQALARATWPPLNVAEACKYAEGEDKKAVKRLRKRTPEELDVCPETLTFSFREPGESELFYAEYSGTFRYRDGRWRAVIENSGVLEDESDDAGPPPIIAAAEAGDVEALRNLLDADPKLLHYHGGDFDIGTFSVDTPLASAAANGHAEAVQFLLDRGARPFKKPCHPCSALLRACANGHLKVVELLLRHGVPAEPPPNTQKKLDDIEQGEDVSPKRLFAMMREDFLDDAPTPLEEAAKHNHPAIVRLLLAHGADPLHRQGLTGDTPLHKGYPFPEVLAVLLEAGVPIDVRDRFGKTALHHATIFGTLLDTLRKQGVADDEFMGEARLYAGAVEHLIALGADINARAENGETPLHLAAQDGSKAYVQYFLDHGADRDAKTGAGKTPLDYAEERDNRDAIELLMETL